MQNKLDHPLVKFGKTGVLLINLGTPDSTSWWDIRKYLKEFLSDRRVIELNPVIWQIILNLFILTFRPSKTAHAYKKIWREESNESPLLFFTRTQANKLNSKIGNKKIQKQKSIKKQEKIGFGFFNYIITYSVFIVFFIGILNFRLYPTTPNRRQHPLQHRLSKAHQMRRNKTYRYPPLAPTAGH